MHIFHYGLSLELLDTVLYMYFHMFLNLLSIYKTHIVCPMHFSIKSLRVFNNLNRKNPNTRTIPNLCTKHQLFLNVPITPYEEPKIVFTEFRMHVKLF